MASVPKHVILPSTDSNNVPIEYLADSVYASYDGYQIKLMTINDYRGGPSNTIYLNEETLEALYTFVEKINRKVQDE